MDRKINLLFTDLYQLTMAYGYWKEKIDKRRAVFHLFFRKKPFGGNYALAAGLETAIEFISRNFRFETSDLDYLYTLKGQRGRPLFEEEFLKYLADLRFSCDVDAVEEGEVVFPEQPLLRVNGPILQAQLLESPLLNMINFQSIIATKASRISIAAQGDQIIEFGMRRAQGVDGAISASRASFIGGCQATSHLLAGKLFSIPVRGTQAHSWVMAFDSEKKAFESFARAFPDQVIVLVDTYDSIEGTKRAVEMAKELESEGVELLGVRLDSGKMAPLSKKIRKLLDSEGFNKTQIMASNELDEYLIKKLKEQGAMISIWGVGTNLVTAKDQPALDGVYKLAAMQDEEGSWIDKIKLSENLTKVTTPGILQIRRFGNKGRHIGDLIYDERLSMNDKSLGYDGKIQKKFQHADNFKDLLIPIFKNGKLVYRSPPILEMQKKAQLELKLFLSSVCDIKDPSPYFVGLEEKLHKKKNDLIDKCQDR